MDPADERAMILATFGEILQQRTIEKRAEARSKWLEDLARIRMENKEAPERRQAVDEGEPVNPLIYLNFHEWVSVLNKLDDSEDIRRARKVCTLFHEALKDKYFSHVLFPQVFALKALKDAFQADKMIMKNFTIFMQDSSSWRNGVTCFFEHSIANRYWQHGADFLLRPSMYALQVSARSEDFKQVEQIIQESEEEKMEEQIKKSNDKKFINPALMINLENFFELDRYGQERFLQLLSNKTTTLLEIFRDEILRFTVKASFVCGFEQLGLSRSQMYLLIKTWILKAPNLRKLNLSVKWVLARFPEVDARDAGEITSLQETIAQNPFPALRHLQTLELAAHSDFDAKVVLPEVLRANSKVKSLILAVTSQVPLKSQTFLTSVNSLENLESYTITYCMHSIRLRDIYSLFNFEWKLTNINLSIVSLSTLSACEIFRLLEGFPLLESVELLLDLINTEDHPDPGFLHLPNVKYFKVGVVRSRRPELDYVESLDFLFPMKKLKKLDWTIREGSTAQEEEIIEFEAGFKDLRYSNIWDIFPSLSEVHLQEESGAPETIFKRGERLNR